MKILGLTTMSRSQRPCPIRPTSVHAIQQILSNLSFSTVSVLRDVLYIYQLQVRSHCYNGITLLRSTMHKIRLPLHISSYSYAFLVKIDTSTVYF